MEDLTAREERVARQFADQSMSGLIAEWDEPMPERERELLRAEMESRGYRTASLVEPPPATAAPPGPGTSSEDDPDDAEVLALTGFESFQGLAAALLVGVAGYTALLVLGLGHNSIWTRGMIAGAGGAAYAGMRVTRKQLGASVEELIEAALELDNNARVWTEEGSPGITFISLRPAAFASCIRVMQVSERASLVVGLATAVDALGRTLHDQVHGGARHR